MDERWQLYKDFSQSQSQSQGRSLISYGRERIYRCENEDDKKRKSRDCITLSRRGWSF